MSVASMPRPAARLPLGAAVLALHLLLAWTLWQWMPRWATAAEQGMPRLWQVVTVAVVSALPPVIALPAPAPPPAPTLTPTPTPAPTPAPTPRSHALLSAVAPGEASPLHSAPAAPAAVQVPAVAAAASQALTAVALRAVESEVAPSHAFSPPPQATTPAAPQAQSAAPAMAPTLAQADHRHCPQVPHPQTLRERGIEGVVHLLMRVSAEGVPAEVRIATGSGWRLFDEAAVLKARGCRFVPARRGSEPVESWVDFPVRFALTG